MRNHTAHGHVVNLESLYIEDKPISISLVVRNFVKHYSEKLSFSGHAALQAAEASKTYILVTLKNYPWS